MRVQQRIDHAGLHMVRLQGGILIQQVHLQGFLFQLQIIHGLAVLRRLRGARHLSRNHAPLEDLDVGVQVGLRLHKRRVQILQPDHMQMLEDLADSTENRAAVWVECAVSTCSESISSLRVSMLAASAMVMAPSSEIWLLRRSTSAFNRHSLSAGGWGACRHCSGQPTRTTAD